MRLKEFPRLIYNMNTLANYEKIKELERETQHFLVAAFDTNASENTLGVRAAVFTDHDDYKIRIDYKLNGKGRTIFMEIPFWSVTDHTDILHALREKLIQDVASLLTEELYLKDICHLDLPNVIRGEKKMEDAGYSKPPILGVSNLVKSLD